MHHILLIFAQMLEIVALSDLVPVLCAKNSSFPPGGIYLLKCPLLANMVLLSLCLQNCASDFEVFAQMLEIVALSDLVSVLCAKKFSFVSRGDLPPKNAPF